MRNFTPWIFALTLIMTQPQALTATPSPVESPTQTRLRMESSEVLGLWQALLSLADRERSPRIGHSGDPELFDELKAHMTQLDARFITKAQRTLDSLDRGFKAKVDLYPRSSSVATPTCRLIIDNQAPQAQDLLDLEARTRLRSICYAPDHAALFTLLHTLNGPYHKIVWEPQRTELERYVREAQHYIHVHKVEINEHLSQIERFYGASISPRVMYCAKAYPTLHKGHSKAAAHGYYIPISVTPSSRDYARSISVITHEFSHELYGNQSAELMKELEDAFTVTPSRASVLTRALLNEGVATAVNNGGMLYARLTGSVKETSWYNDPLIDRFARALYPLLTEYITEKKTMDSTLITRSIELYREAFKDQSRNVRLMLSNAHVSGFTQAQTVLIRRELRKVKSLVSRGESAPFTVSKVKEIIEGTLAEQGTIVLGAYMRSQLQALPTEIDTVYKEALKTISPDAESFAVLSARDEKAPLLILVAPNDQALTKLFKEIRSIGYLKEPLKVIELP